VFIDISDTILVLSDFNQSFPNPNAPEGQYQMSSAVELWLPTPSTTDSNQTFAQWCYSTQIFQSMTMVAQIAWYRRGAGQGENNLGSLVWQLNDICKSRRREIIIHVNFIDYRARR
jgi:hypothetical protein